MKTQPQNKNHPKTTSNPTNQMITTTTVTINILPKGDYYEWD